MKNSSDTIWNRTRDLPICSAVPQPTALMRAPSILVYHSDNRKFHSVCHSCVVSRKTFSNFLHTKFSSIVLHRSVLKCTRRNFEVYGCRGRSHPSYESNRTPNNWWLRTVLTLKRSENKFTCPRVP